MPKDQKEPKVTNDQIVSYIRRQHKVSTRQVADMFRIRPNIAKDRLNKIELIHRVGLSNHNALWAIKETS